MGASIKVALLCEYRAQSVNFSGFDVGVSLHPARPLLLAARAANTARICAARSAGPRVSPPTQARAGNAMPLRVGNARARCRAALETCVAPRETATTILAKARESGTD
jgi:hypothetical protein